MTSSSAIHIDAGYSWIAIARDPLRLSARHSAIDAPRCLLVARAAIDSKEEPGCSTEHAR